MMGKAFKIKRLDIKNAEKDKKFDFTLDTFPKLC
jgi:hypothetical protein